MAGGDTNNDRVEALENTEHYIRMRDSGHLDFVEKARACESFVQGYPNKQWESSVLAKLNAEGRPAMTINKVFPSVAATMGEQLQNQVDVAFRPTASGNEETSHALDTSWVYVSNNNMMDWRRSEVFDDGLITGRGFYDMRMNFDDNLKGNIRIRKMNNRNALIDPDADSYDPDDWNECAITRWFTPEHIAANYDTAKAKEIEQRATTNFRHGFDFLDVPTTTFGRSLGHSGGLLRNSRQKKFARVIERQYKQLEWREHFVDTQSGETRVISSTWDRERIGMVLENLPHYQVLKLQSFVYRWTVSTLDLLLFSAESPYKHFTLVPYFPMLVGGVGIGLVENLLGPQEVLNKTASQELHVVNTTANSGWQVKENSLRNMDTQELEQRGAQTGLVVEVTEIGDIQKIQPNPVPQGLDLISLRARQDVQDVSLINKSQLGTDRADVSGRAREAGIQRGPVNLAKPLANLVRTEHMLARNVVGLIQSYWTEERALRVTRKNRGRDETVEIVINQMTPEGNMVNDVTLGEYDVITSTVSLREQAEDTEFEELRGLRELGVEISDERLVELSKARNKKKILEDMDASAQARQEDLDRERKLKDAELEEKQTDVQVRKSDAMEKLARAKRTGEESQLIVLEKQTEVLKADTARQLAENDRIRLELDRDELAFKREESRRNSRLEKAKLKQGAVNNGG